MKFEPNKAGMKKLEKKLTKPVSIPASKSDSAAASSLKREMAKRGVKITDSAARKAVKDARKSK